MTTHFDGGSRKWVGCQHVADPLIRQTSNNPLHPLAFAANTVLCPGEDVVRSSGLFSRGAQAVQSSLDLPSLLFLASDHGRCSNCQPEIIPIARTSSRCAPPFSIPCVDEHPGRFDRRYALAVDTGPQDRAHDASSIKSISATIGRWSDAVRACQLRTTSQARTVSRGLTNTWSMRRNGSSDGNVASAVRRCGTKSCASRIERVSFW